MANLASLRADIKQWSQRKNIPESVLNSFIEIALSRANWALRIPSLEAYAAVVVSDTGYAQIPKDFIELKELSLPVGSYTKVLDRKSVAEVDSVSNFSGGGAYPEIFGRYGNYFKIAPWSLGEDEYVNLYYYAALPQLIDDSDTNWFTDWAPNLLLYGALAELCDYTRDTEGSQLWAGKFTNEINIVQAVEDKAQWSGSSLAVTATGSIKGRRAI